VEELEEQSNRVDKILRNGLDSFGIRNLQCVCVLQGVHWGGLDKTNAN